MSRLTSLRLLAVAAACIAASLGAPGTAPAARPLATGFADPYYITGDTSVRDFVFDRTVTDNAEIVRINLQWQVAAPTRPADPRNPADPAYQFDVYDRAIEAVARRGLKPLITIYRAPNWAEGPGRPFGVPDGSWRPDAGAFGDFAHAVATRYSGGFAVGGVTLPRAQRYQIWNEPNIPTYITPQYEGDARRSPEVYRDLLNAGYAAIKGVDPQAVVATAGTGPYGDPPGGNRVRPLTFWRDVFCLGSGNKPQPVPCSAKPSFDVLAHNPINTSGPPTHGAIDPEDISTPDLPRLVRLLRRAEQKHQIATGGRHPVWATEIWWETDPPDATEGIPPKQQARYLEQSMYLLWKAGASMVLNLQVRDVPFEHEDRFLDNTTGIYYADGSPKPSARAFRFPFVTHRKATQKLEVWGKAPKAGKLRIQKRGGGGWKTVSSQKVKRGQVFDKTLKLEARATLRARIGGAKSLPWSNR